MSIRDAMSHITHGTYVIGTKTREKENLMTAAWLSQVSSRPACIAVAVSEKHLTAEMIEKTGSFTVSVLSEEQYGEAYRCGTISGREADKTAGELVEHDEKGNPFLKDAAAYLSCKLLDTVKVTDHILFIGEVTEGNGTPKKDMVYCMEEILTKGKGK
ncbi:flavin reductase family protein [Anaerosacchariphilus sp. NSJ-68]|uniref:Flavin reductase family protein n=2 Tax=Lachnospiraceae TaxID=186803 RepID=A0A923RNA4_9FIRM|nr:MULTISPECIES: flavin reductase family protein [Lachnospiraceae]MBC5660281.1 flavin reductase family protein [Anaerosacchariphilus hominis]MBC5697871.1 flavin reductase family protein [Roseburia difficilis]